jgi:hypothetical protein
MEKASPQELVRIVDDSHVPLAEEEQRLSSIRGKVKRGERLSKDEEEFLHMLVEKAKEWQKAVQSSADTELEYTLSG